MLDLHRHDEFSEFDGFGKPMQLAKIAKELNYTALGIANHGNANGLIEHNLACKEFGLLPIFGCEVYFQPKFDNTTGSIKYHLCLFVKNSKGYENLNKILTISNTDKFYYKPTVDFELLEKYSEGLICTSACVASIISQSIIKKNNKQLEKALSAFVRIFGDDFYLEIQPYKLNEKLLQEKVNVETLKISKGENIKCIITSDSHFGKKEDFPTYVKMHEMGGRSANYDIEMTYSERYMPTKKELLNRFKQMHKKDFKNVDKVADMLYKNLKGLESKVENGILDDIELVIPKLHLDSKISSKKMLKNQIINGLKKLNKYNKKYLDRCKSEYDVVCQHGFEDYFLMVRDYVEYAKANKIKMGPGRGSVCNSLLAYAIGITEVDSILFNLDYRRFMRPDKTSLPDIDLDFETSRRQEVIDYVVEKYKGESAQISNYGLYKEDNLLNDLFKVCGVEDKTEQTRMKAFIKNKIEAHSFDYEKIKDDAKVIYYNSNYDNIIVHFNKMFKKVKFISTHAGGVVITNGPFTKYFSLQKRKNKFLASYDLNNLEKLNVIKFDILGLRTMTIIKELEELTGEKYNDNWTNNEGSAKLYEMFYKGKTNGIFQFEKDTAKEILSKISCDCFNDVIAASSLNRPGPLSLEMHSTYGENKRNADNIEKTTPYYNELKDTYNTIIYQEQIVGICVNVAKMSWTDADSVLKFLKGSVTTARSLKEKREKGEYLTKTFIDGAVKYSKIGRAEATDLFEKITTYSFNRGHATAYSIISLILMYYKCNHPVYFWSIIMKYANEAMIFKYKKEAVKDGIVIMLPHVNYTSKHYAREIKGEGMVIQEGTSTIKFVGEKASLLIEAERIKNGPFKNVDDFTIRCKSRSVTSRTISALLESGALEFNKKKYLSRVVKYNSSLYS